MSKYYKLVWSGRLIEKELKAFDARMRHELGIKSSDAGTYSGAAIGDFNGDGYQDVLICYFDKNFQRKDSHEPTPAQYVLLNGAKGNKFVDATKTLPDDGNIPGAPTKIMVDDFNGDGVDDIAVVTSYEDGRSNADEAGLESLQHVRRRGHRRPPDQATTPESDEARPRSPKSYTSVNLSTRTRCGSARG